MDIHEVTRTAWIIHHHGMVLNHRSICKFKIFVT